MSESTIKKTVELTYEQVFFYKSKQRLATLKKLEQEQALSYEQLQERDQILSMLWKSILKFAIRESHLIMQKYSLSSDAYFDVQQELAVIFFEKLDAYEPLLSTPTTYYVRYFRQAITEYVRGYSQNLSQYDANNLKLVRRAVNYYESKGIAWTEEMIVSKTNLSAKIVKTTLYFGLNSKHASVDDAMNVKSSIPTPEEAFHQKQSSEILYSALIRDICPEDLQLLLIRVNANGDKELPYEKIARKIGKPVKEVKSRLNKIICTLNQDEVLCHEFSNVRDRTISKPLTFQDHAVDVSEAQLSDFLRHIQ